MRTQRRPNLAAPGLLGLVAVGFLLACGDGSAPAGPQVPGESAGIAFTAGGDFSASGVPRLSATGQLEPGGWAILFPDTSVGGSLVAFLPTGEGTGSLFRLHQGTPLTIGTVACPSECSGILALNIATDGSASGLGFHVVTGTLTIAELSEARAAGTFAALLRSDDPEVGDIVIDDGRFDVPVTVDPAAGEAACFVATALGQAEGC